MSSVPDGVTISRLVYPVVLDGKRKLSDIILLGVKRRTVIHASYVADFLDALKPESVFLQVPPDLPMFIKSQGQVAGGYRSRWFSFLRNAQDSSFYVSTKPEYLTDVILSNKDRLKRLIDRNIEPSVREFEIGTRVLYSRYRPLSRMTLAADALLTPLLYGYNCSMVRPVKTCCGDMPMLIQRDIYANTLKLEQA